MRNSGVSPREERDCSLSAILLEHVPRRYYLSRRACRGILRRAKERGKPLPPQLELALLLQAGSIRPPPGIAVSALLLAAKRMAVREILDLLEQPDELQ